jgi:hypothetical protein
MLERRAASCPAECGLRGGSWAGLAWFSGGRAHGVRGELALPASRDRRDPAGQTCAWGVVSWDGSDRKGVVLCQVAIE